jgi:hypothetical protein
VGDLFNLNCSCFGEAAVRFIHLTAWIEDHGGMWTMPPQLLLLEPGSYSAVSNTENGSSIRNRLLLCRIGHFFCCICPIRQQKHLNPPVLPSSFGCRIRSHFLVLADADQVEPMRCNPIL